MNLADLTDDEIVDLLVRETYLPSEETIDWQLAMRLGGKIEFIGGPADGKTISMKPWLTTIRVASQWCVTRIAECHRMTARQLVSIYVLNHGQDGAWFYKYEATT